MRSFILPLPLFLAVALHAENSDNFVEAKLIGPEVIQLAENSVVHWKLPYEIDFTWPREQPFEADLYIIDGRIAIGPHVDFEIRDSKGSKVKTGWFMSMPGFPNGHITVQKGRSLRVPIYAWNGISSISFSETYTIYAELKGKCGDAHVKLRTQSLKVRFNKHPTSPQL